MDIEIIFAIISVLSLLFCAAVIIDRAIFSQKVADIMTGMTGREIQDATKLKVEITEVKGNVFYARVRSTLSIFRYRLAFCNGRLISKQRD